MTYRQKYNSILHLTPQARGTEFEKLINEIFEDNGILISARYRTSDTQQEIDGAIQIFGRIFLVEVKWENTKTLAASKLFSFIGKVQTKIEGTLGLFISHEQLSDNFTDAIRNGLRQNCILIHGNQNINDIIDENIDVKQYLEYCYLQASIKNRVDISTSEFAAIPQKATKNDDKPPVKDEWLDIYNKLVNDTSLADFIATIHGISPASLKLSEKLLNVYPALDVVGSPKLKALFEYLTTKDSDTFTNILVDKLKGIDWRLYSDPAITDILHRRVMLSEKQREEILDNLKQYIHYSNYEDENSVSRVLEMYYDQLTLAEKEAIAEEYFEIHMDNFRAERFAQKKFASKLFADLRKEKGEYFSVVEKKIKNQISTLKKDHKKYFNDRPLADFLFGAVHHWFERAFVENNVKITQYIQENLLNNG